jgi:ProP effector
MSVNDTPPSESPEPREALLPGDPVDSESSTSASPPAAGATATATATAPEAVAATDPPPPDALVAPAPAREPGLSPAQTATRLAELYPALFGGVPKPIKLRIQADIQLRAPGVFTKRVLSFFLSRHTTTTPYLKALVTETQRFDLDGQPAGEVAPEHKQAAIDELARRRQIVEERRAAERAARAVRPPRGPRDTRGPGDAPAPAGETLQRAPGHGDSSGSERTPASDGPARTPRPPRDQRRPAREGSAEGSRRAQPNRPREPHAGTRPSSNSSTEPRGGPRGPGPNRSQDRFQGRPSDSRPSERDWTPTDPAQRDRAALLRAWESTALTKGNFCALKRLSEADFDAQLAQAQQERKAARSA